MRGYGFQADGWRSEWERGEGHRGLGADFKDSLIHELGPWRFGFGGFGEMPAAARQLRGDPTPPVRDKWGIPALHIQLHLGANELALLEDMQQTAAEMLEAAGATHIETFNEHLEPGHCIHEMGTARMGRDPKTSVLNGWNQCHDVPNLFVTDGACMASSANQNPSITYMALTARACDYAVRQMARHEL